MRLRRPRSPAGLPLPGSSAQAPHGPLMTARVGRVVLPNPVMTASGTSGHGSELGAYFDLSRLGAVVVKSLSAQPWEGNRPPRLLPLPAGMLNSVGLQNPGIDAWLREDLPPLLRTGARVVVSVWGRSGEQFGEVGRRLVAGLARAGLGPGEPVSAELAGNLGAGGVVAVEADISCPNLEDRHRMFAHSAEGTAAAIGALCDALSPSGLPVWAKLSPNVTDLVAIAEAALANGAEALTLVNTLMGLAVAPGEGAALLGGGGGGLSGPALHPVAVRAVHDCSRAFPGTPIVGAGGVMSGRDAASSSLPAPRPCRWGPPLSSTPRAPFGVLLELERWCSSEGPAGSLYDRLHREH